MRDSVGLLSGRGDERPGRATVAFDCVPAIGAVSPNGASAYEERFAAELDKLLGERLPAMEKRLLDAGAPWTPGQAIP